MRIMKAASTSKTIYVVVLDSTSTTGGRKTGLAYNTSSLTAYYTIGLAAAVQITLATQTVTGAYSSGGFVEVSSTNAPGLYRLDIPNAAIASGEVCVVTLQGATGMVPVAEEIMLVPWDPQDTVRLGLTALPNAAAEAAGGLYTRGSGAGQINQTNNGQVDANAARLGGTTTTGRDIGASVLLSAGTGTGQLDFTSGVVKANLAQILGTAITETAGQIAAAFKQFFDVASPTGTMKAITLVTTTTTATNLTNAPTTGDFTATMKTSIGTAVAASAVASVTGNVGGNVTGSVGSLASGAIASTSFASGAITAAAIATDAIGAAELAADAVTEIQSGLATSSALSSLVTTVGVAGLGLTEAGGTGDQYTAVPWNASWDAEVQSEVEDALNVQLADSVPSDGTIPTLRQAIYMLAQFMFERSVSSTTLTVKKVNGSTSLMTFTLDDATNPTSITRAT